MCEIDEMRASLGVRGPTPDGGYETAATLPADTRITVPGGCYSPRCNLWSTATGAECRTCGVKFASIAEAAMHRENTRLAAEVNFDNSLITVWQKRCRAAEARVAEMAQRVRELEWQIYRMLEEGEIIEATDEILDDVHGWRPIVNCIGDRAPDPAYTSHRKYRRRRVLEGATDD